MKPVTQKSFSTAGGRAKTEKVFPVRVEALDNTISDPYVMKSTPELLSIGLRCMKKGFSFIWLAGHFPCLIPPSYNIVPLDIISYIPYLVKDGPVSSLRDPDEIAAATGVFVSDGKLQISAGDCAAAEKINRKYKQKSRNADDENDRDPTARSSSEACPVDAGTKVKDSASSGAPAPKVNSDATCPKGDVQTLTAEKPREEDDKVRRNLAEEVQKKSHKLTHKPAMPEHCDSCMRGKRKRKKKRKGVATSNPEKFGDIITVDHVHLKDWVGDPGVGGYTDTFNMLDLATKFKCAKPVKSKDADRTLLTIKYWIGEDSVKKIYSDGHESIKKACKNLTIPHQLAQPGIHQNNGIIERCNSDILAGTRTLLVEAGLPSCFWPYAAACYCHHDNVSVATTVLVHGLKGSGTNSLVKPSRSEVAFTSCLRPRNTNPARQMPECNVEYSWDIR